MGPTTSAILGLMAISAVPAAVRAYPSDSLLLVRIATLGSSGDTLKDREFSYAKDDQGYWYASDFYRRPGPLDSSGASLSSEYDYAYDAQGRLRTETFLSGGVAAQTVTYGYDSAGRVGSRLSLKANGDTLYAKTFAYDGEGRLIREISVYGNDTLSLLYVEERTEYDANGNVKTKKQYDKDGYLMTTDAYAYATVHVPVSLAPSRSRRAATRSGFREGSLRDALGRFLERGGETYPGFLAAPDRRRFP